MSSSKTTSGLFLLFPGRHLLTTNFQFSYLLNHLCRPVSEWTDFYNHAFHTQLNDHHHVSHVVFCVTSANQQNSRYNPIPFYVRSIGLDRFGQELVKAYATENLISQISRVNRENDEISEDLLMNDLIPDQRLKYSIVPVPHFNPSDKFASNLIKLTREHSEGELMLHPDNTIVLSSTMDVIKQFDKLGYSVITAEMQRCNGTNEKEYELVANLPVQVLTKMVDEVGDGHASHKNWPLSKIVESDMHRTTKSTWIDFIDVPKRIFRLWNDPILNDSGSLTETRNYDTYAWEMSNTTVINLKWNDIKNFVKTGKIVDEGCADGALLLCISKDYPDCDLIGVEITTEFLARCHERQRLGQFGSSFVFFHQRNITKPIFEDNSIDTTICNSTIHELYSYSPVGTQEKVVKDYLQFKFNQLRPGGRLIVRDVIGPEEKDKTVLLWLNHKDGKNYWLPSDPQQQRLEYEHKVQTTVKGHTGAMLQLLNELSTFALFDRFVKDFDFSKEIYNTMEYYEIDGEYFVKTTLRGAAEFMLTKDYHNNWESEMHETFTFWSLSDWKRELNRIGFKVIETAESSSANPVAATRSYTNEWIAKHRFEGHCKIYECPKMDDHQEALSLKTLKELPQPPTNVIIVSEKPSYEYELM
ncbi:hypothetical protein C9374_011243 [Naegleria lovaniensis]|uniref:Methyltransferase domain-containing protein n=1 Tax=Naegleria lovaniensis TaxID=51637 RepID=A0AA88H0F4_NAELO|nr:uncharacterized protein C9374_011243 [Naegleria lovaniensis]KAG2392518.1 hypothetical protein C9374_011243 [Naegleria lovaniensis]